MRVYVGTLAICSGVLAASGVDGGVDGACVGSVFAGDGEGGIYLDMHQDDSFKVQLVRVTYPGDKPTIEQQLAKTRKANLYSPSTATSAITTANILLCTSIPAIRYGIGISWQERSACHKYVTQDLRLLPRSE